MPLIGDEDMRWFRFVFLSISCVAISNCAYLPEKIRDSLPKAQSAPAEKSDSNETKPTSKAHSEVAKPVSDDAAENTLDKKQHASTTSLKSRKKVARTSPISLPPVIDIAEGKVVFLRSSVVASAIEAVVYEVVGGMPKFVAVADNNTQIHHKVLPGQHTFMLVSGESLDYLQVEVMPNKTYYSIVKPSMGAWKPSFHLEPIKQRNSANTTIEQDTSAHFFDDEQVETLLSAMTPIIDTHRVDQTVELKDDAVQKHSEQWQLWRALLAEEKLKKTLTALDGR